MIQKAFHLIITAILLQICRSQGLPNPALGIRKCGKVHLTVSALKSTYLEMNWITKCDKARDIKPDTIGLFNYNPRDRHEASPLVMLKADSYPEGFYTTAVKFTDAWLPGNWELQPDMSLVDAGRQCFPYWIASFRGFDIIDTNCLAINPTWMNDIRDQIKDQRIGNLFIPGTHNSGAFTGKKFFFENYILNQDQSIWKQLVFGIRYFDFRIGYYHNDGFYINHDLVKIDKLVPMLREIRTFMEVSPKEVVILDFHRFPYPTTFPEDAHYNLVSILEKELGHLALLPGGLQAGKGPTMNEIWQQNKTLIMCYGDRNIARDHPWLWNPLQQHWGDKSTASDLKSYIAGVIKSHNTIFNPMWAIMAELTPKPVDVIFRTNSLRKLANDVNRHLTIWMRDDYGKDVNIVASDFFLGNNLIDVAIDINRQR